MHTWQLACFHVRMDIIDGVSICSTQAIHIHRTSILKKLLSLVIEILRFSTCSLVPSFPVPLPFFLGPSPSTPSSSAPPPNCPSVTAPYSPSGGERMSEAWGWPRCEVGREWLNPPHLLHPCSPSGGAQRSEAEVEQGWRLRVACIGEGARGRCATGGSGAGACNRPSPSPCAFVPQQLFSRRGLHGGCNGGEAAVASISSSLPSPRRLLAPPPSSPARHRASSSPPGGACRHGELGRCG
jgi:hypothetical protein